MKLTAADLPKLQYSLFAAVLMLALGAGSAYFAFKATASAQGTRLIAQAERDSTDGKLKRVRQEENDIKQKSALFNTLQKRGVIGEEQRLEWVELLKRIRLQRQLLELQYEIAPQRPLEPLPGSSYGFFASAMKVQLKLLHEEDLTRLLADLREQAGALIRVRNCKVARQPDVMADRQVQTSIRARLEAECLIDWVTVREVTVK